jgi:serine/threonine-protein kinase
MGETDVGDSTPNTEAAGANAHGIEALLSAGQVLAGRYRIERILGRGGMGEVYVATHINTGLIVACKVLLPELSRRSEFLRRFQAEARAVAALRHPGIVRVTDFDHDGDLHFLVMEKLEGESLTERIRTAAPLPIPFVLRVGIDLCEAISVAHEHSPRIIHRDLKPDNVFLTKEGARQDVVKILDFGIAKLIDSDLAPKITLTATGSLAGTPFYMAPEQMVNAKDVDERADIYAIGVILFQALTGVTPYQADSIAELVLKIHSEPPQDLRKLRPDVSQELADTISRTLLREREQRLPTAAKLGLALEACLEGRPVCLTPGPTWIPLLETNPFGQPPSQIQLGRPRSRKRWYLLLGTIVLLAAAAALVVLGRVPFRSAPATPVVSAPPVAPAPSLPVQAPAPAASPSPAPAAAGVAPGPALPAADPGEAPKRHAAGWSRQGAPGKRVEPNPGRQRPQFHE